MHITCFRRPPFRPVPFAAAATQPPGGAAAGTLPLSGLLGQDATRLHCHEPGQAPTAEHSQADTEAFVSPSSAFLPIL